MTQKQPYEMTASEYFEYVQGLHWTADESRDIRTYRLDLKEIRRVDLVELYRQEVVIPRAVAEGKIIPENVRKELGILSAPPGDYQKYKEQEAQEGLRTLDEVRRELGL